MISTPTQLSDEWTGELKKKILQLFFVFVVFLERLNSFFINKKRKQNYTTGCG